MPMTAAIFDLWLDAVETSVDASDTFADPVAEDGEEVARGVLVNERGTLTGEMEVRKLGALRVKDTTERVDDDDVVTGTSVRLDDVSLSEG